MSEYLPSHGFPEDDDDPRDWPDVVDDGTDDDDDWFKCKPLDDGDNPPLDPREVLDAS